MYQVYYGSKQKDQEVLLDNWSREDFNCHGLLVKPLKRLVACFSLSFQSAILECLLPCSTCQMLLPFSELRRL